VVGKNSEVVCRKLAEQGLAKIGYGKVRERNVIRLVTVNPELREEDLEALLAQILTV